MMPSIPALALSRELVVPLFADSKESFGATWALGVKRLSSICESTRAPIINAPPYTSMTEDFMPRHASRRL